MPSEPDFFTIDKNQLDREWVLHDRLVKRWGEQLAQAQLDLEQAETKLEVIDADLDYKIRRRAERAKTKITEAGVKNQIIRSIEHIDAVNKIQKLRYAVNMVKIAVKRADHHKTALENLVDLRLADYFSEPRAGRKSQEHLDERVAQRARRPMDNPSDD